MDENTWTASTETSWLFFDSAHTVKILTGTGGESITIYVEEATEPTTDVEGIITISANGTTFTKTIKRCSPSITSTAKTLTFEVYYSKVGGDTVGPCENGTSDIDSYGVRIRNIKLTTVENYSNGQSKTTEQTLLDSDVNIWYILPDGSKYSTLPSNKGQDRLVSVRVELKSNPSVFALQENAFTQRGIKDGTGNYITDRLHDVGYSSESTEYRNFAFAQSCINQSSTSCHEGTFTYNITGQKVTIYGGKTGLTECNELVNIGGGTESPADIPTSEVTFNVTPTECGSFNGNVLSYAQNESRSQGRVLNVSATLNGTSTIYTTFTVIAGNDCGDPLYIVFKCNRENIDFTGGTATFKYYLANAEGASESEAITDQTLNGCLQFVPPQGVTTGNPLYSNGVYSVDVTFTQNTYMNGEEGKTWEFKATCPDAVNDPQIISLYQANKWEQIIPNCDYFIFKYIWGDDDGKDLDSLTHLSSCPELSAYTVGWYGTAPGGTPARTYVVQSSDGKPYLKFGGDNRCNGSEYTIVCLKNIVEDFRQRKITFENDIMWVDIYANWYSKRESGNMKIVYSQYTGLTTGGYSEEINEKEHLNECLQEPTKYYSFEPIAGNCESIAEDVESNTININAAGTPNHIFAYDNVNCIDGAYSHALRLIYNFAAKTTSIQYFKDTGLNTMEMDIKFSIDGVDHAATYNNTASTNGQAVHVVYDNVYIKHKVNGILYKLYPYDDDNDYMEYRLYLPKSERTSIFKYKKSDLGSTINLPHVKNFKIIKKTDDTLKIEFDMEQTTEETEFDIHFYLYVNNLLPCGKAIYDFRYIQTFQEIR